MTPERSPTAAANSAHPGARVGVKVQEMGHQERIPIMELLPTGPTFTRGPSGDFLVSFHRWPLVCARPLNLESDWTEETVASSRGYLKLNCHPRPRWASPRARPRSRSRSRARPGRLAAARRAPPSIDLRVRRHACRRGQNAKPERQTRGECKRTARSSKLTCSFCVAARACRNAHRTYR